MSGDEYKAWASLPEALGGGWIGAERKDPAIAADQVSRACLRGRISNSRKEPLILHSNNGNA